MVTQRTGAAWPRLRQPEAQDCGFAAAERGDGYFL